MNDNKNIPKVKDLKFDTKAMYGETFGLSDIDEVAIWKDNVKTNEFEYIYDLVCVEKKMKHIYVKYPRKIMDTPEDIVPVEVSDLEVSPYVRDGRLYLNIKASNIKLMK